MNSKPLWKETESLSRDERTLLRLEREIKRQDAVELPMDEKFFDELHAKIMDSVEKTEVKPLSRWAKTWVFLETRARRHREVIHSSVRSIFMGGLVALGWGAMQFSAAYYAKAEAQQKQLNKLKIIETAAKNPLEWVEMAGQYQNESDIYAEVLSRKLDRETLAKIQSVLDEDL